MQGLAEKSRNYPYLPGEWPQCRNNSLGFHPLNQFNGPYSAHHLSDMSGSKVTLCHQYRNQRNKNTRLWVGTEKDDLRDHSYVLCFN